MYKVLMVRRLQATDFGETRSSDGVWVPKEYTGFGTNPNDGTTWSDRVTLFLLQQQQSF